MLFSKQHEKLERARSLAYYPFSARPFSGVNVPPEIPALDLILAISMTTAFASLTDNTDVLTGDGAISYLCFFALVWWIWASQVAYNARFRHRDILHCIFAFLTFIVYGGLAAFTGDFDITDGLSDDSDSETQQVQKFEQDFGIIDQSTIDAEQFRSSRLPSLNARGICLVMGLSRVLLLVQHLRLLYLAPKEQRRPLKWHCGGLIFSMAAFFTTYGVLRHSNSAVSNGIKIALWYAAIVVEVATHYMANRDEDKDLDRASIPYRSAPLSKRISELFIIILGAGLDQITKSFHTEVGTLGFGPHTIEENSEDGNSEKSRKRLEDEEKSNEPELTNVASRPPMRDKTESGVSTIEVIKHPDEPSDRRLLTWFFFNFVFLACIILTLQATARLVAYDNLQSAFTELVNLIDRVLETIENNSTWSIDQFSEANTAFQNLGISFSDWLAAVDGTVKGVLQNDNASLGQIDEFFAVPVVILFQGFKVIPEDGSILAIELDFLLNGNDSDSVQAAQILTDVEVSQVHCALWFFGVAGGTLMALAVMNAIRHQYIGQSKIFHSEESAFDWPDYFRPLSVDQLNRAIYLRARICPPFGARHWFATHSRRGLPPNTAHSTRVEIRSNQLDSRLVWDSNNSSDPLRRTLAILRDEVRVAVRLWYRSPSEQGIKQN
ncbi:hypothetical protein SISNIDRAFT_491012 [Sistotremastrum niveocremeum HHB9708]|uniref:Uncharacterized protein n=1 Tax=Sistotremastrum niveocremeum HHB9708 TaxID=1314777 RepID=A0A164N809_9AGAM|nr:hypothetical protein SISNIDRAFT_491012 [Sistotremastrum niveocremeum HHB9708]